MILWEIYFVGQTVAQLLSFCVGKITLLQDNQYLFLFVTFFCLLNAVADMFSSCIVQ